MSDLKIKSDLNVTGALDVDGNATVNGNATIDGDLTVSGTTVTVNTATLEVEDQNILINNGGNDASSEGAGLTVERTSTNGSLVYENALASKWKAGAAGGEIEVANVSSAQTLSSKTLSAPAINGASTYDQIATPASPSASKNKFYFKSDDKPYRLNSSGVEVEVGSGGGGGGGSSGINYIDANPSFETDTTGWAAYADAASALPADGTGGAPAVTITRSVTSPLRDVASGLITKDSANRQGEGVSYAFSVDNADLASVLKISFDYIVSSGTFAAGSDSTNGDVNVYIYDVSNAVLIQPTPFKLTSNSSATPGKYSAYFQTAQNSTSYRLIFHVASTSASAWVLKIDNVNVGPEAIVNGVPATDWDNQLAFTFDNIGTVSNNAAWSKRVGSDLHIRGYVQSGTASASAFALNLPSGYAIDTAKFSTPAQSGILPGMFYRVTSAINFGTGDGAYQPFYDGASSSKIFIARTGSAASAGVLAKANGSAISGGGETVSYEVVVPIAGWSSNVQMSNDADTRVCAAQISGDPASASASNPIIVPTVGFDTHGAYNASTGRYTLPISGIYRIHGFMDSGSADFALDVFLDAVFYSRLGETDSTGDCAFTGLVKGNAGQLIDLRSQTGTLNATNVYLNIERLSGPATIAASEKVQARAYQATGTVTISSAAQTKIVYTTESYDSHGAYDTSTSRFTAPSAGVYSVKSGGYFDQLTAAQDMTIQLWKNGALYSGGFYNVNSTATMYVSLSDDIKLNAGDYIEMYVSSGGDVSYRQNSGGDGSYTFFSIAKN